MFNRSIIRFKARSPFSHTFSRCKKESFVCRFDIFDHFFILLFHIQKWSLKRLLSFWALALWLVRPKPSSASHVKIKLTTVSLESWQLALNVLNSPSLAGRRVLTSLNKLAPKVPIVKIRLRMYFQVYQFVKVMGILEMSTSAVTLTSATVLQINATSFLQLAPFQIPLLLWPFQSVLFSFLN